MRSFGARRCKVFAPMPLTRRSSCTRWNFLSLSRKFKIACARFSPIPGNVRRSATVAVLRMTLPSAVRPAQAFGAGTMGALEGSEAGGGSDEPAAEATAGVVIWT